MANIPSIIAWNRLEPRPRSKDFNRALRAEVRDPLWMLTRQWQMGEFKAENRVSPAYVEVEVERDAPDGFRPVGSANFTVIAENLPLETVVERSFIPRDLGLELQMGRHWGKMLRSSDLGQYVTDFIAADPITAPGSQTETMQSIKTDEWAFRRSAAGKALNGLALYEKIQTNSSYALTVIGNSGKPGSALATGTSAEATAFQEKIRGLATAFIAWFRRLYTQPEQNAEPVWDASRLEYNFEVSTGTGQVLTSSGFHNGRLDWYSFDRKAAAGNLSPATEVESFIPTQVQFPGMSATRWWEMEDQKVSFADLQAAPSDLNRLLFLEFMYSYKNDWFIVPLTVNNGTLCQVKSLVVTDVFGFKHRIKGANEGIYGNWSMFATHKENTDLRDTDRLLFVPPVVTKTLESPSTEKVSFLRDEMANMVWGIEQVVPDGLGRGMSGYEAAVRYRNALLKDNTMAEPENGDALTFKLASSVPANWIPFIPVQVDEMGSVRLQRAVLPVTESPAETVVPEPGTAVLSSPSPYFIHEEEITRAGTVVERTFQRARWYNGKTVVWSGYKKMLGRGEGNSGLIFDQLKTREV